METFVISLKDNDSSLINGADSAMDYYISP